MEMKDRIKQRTKELNLSQAALAEAVGISQVAIHNLASGKTTKTSKLLQLAKALQCNPDWLENGGNDADGSMIFEVQPFDADTGQEIPYLDIEGSCGEGATVYPEHEAKIKGVIKKEASWFKRFNVRPKDAFCVYAKGDSMQMFLVDGDMVIFDKSKTTPVSGKIFLIRHPEGLKIKLLRQQLSGSWSFESYNSAFKPEEITEDMLERVNILGQFVYRQGG